MTTVPSSTGDIEQYFLGLENAVVRDESDARERDELLDELYAVNSDDRAIATFSQAFQSRLQKFFDRQATIADEDEKDAHRRMHALQQTHIAADDPVSLDRQHYCQSIYQAVGHERRDVWQDLVTEEERTAKDKQREQKASDEKSKKHIYEQL